MEQKAALFNELAAFLCYFITLRGRQEGTKGVCGITHKSPIAIDPHSGMFFFPTTSPNNPTCAWIAHSHIFQIKPLDKDKTKIIFKTGQEIIVSVSYGSMMNQIQRTAQFRYKLTERLHYTWNGDHEKVAEPFI
ncbi:competence protein ComK [Salinibacillus kushneri]|uniref:competence protein ComK n=1 Tax=Salinibacillus kushneri TaxID=237682 RepID=UPI0015A55C37|nr:competence protein ComK [Salinibacillus kushneri]